MKVFADNQMIKMLSQNTSEIEKNPFISDPNNQVSLCWSSLLEYLNVGSLLKNLPPFDATQPLYKACLTILSENVEKEVLFNLYDSLFAECLNQIKALPQVNASFLLNAIKAHRNTKSVSSSIEAYETAFIENASSSMHDLILYLAWDRMCVCMANLFDYQSIDSKFIKALEVLKECLIESYLHISRQAWTSPSFYRLVEALFFYQMREENLQKNSASAWKTLSESFQILKAQDELPDFFYIDNAVIPIEMHKSEVDNSECYLTLDSPDRVSLRLNLAQFVIDLLNAEVSEWDYILQPKKIVCLNPERF